MSTLNSASSDHRFFRSAALVFAFVLVCEATWILVAEFNRPALAAFPANAQAAEAAAAEHSAAMLAASVGVIRGDLWAEAALTSLGAFWNDDQNKIYPQISESIERDRAVAIRALSLSPHDARIWLVLASIDSRIDSLDHQASDALRMSYYTGANEPELIALRLPLAVQSGALDDDDFRRLVSHDIRIIVTRRPELKPLILATYYKAPPSGRQFIEQVLQELDPSLLATLQPQ